MGKQIQSQSYTRLKPLIRAIFSSLTTTLNQIAGQFFPCIYCVGSNSSANQNTNLLNESDLLRASHFSFNC